MTNIFVFILAFFAAEGLWVTLTGRPYLRRKLGFGRHELEEDIEERAKRVRTTMDRIRDRNRHLDHGGSRTIGSGVEVLRALPPGKMRRN